MTWRQDMRDAQTEYAAGRLAAAEAKAQAVVAAHPGCADAHHLLGVIRLTREEPEPALPFLAEAVRLAPQCGDFHNSYGVACHLTGASEHAARAYRQALTLAPGGDFPPARDNLRRLLAEDGRLIAATPEPNGRDDAARPRLLMVGAVPGSGMVMARLGPALAEAGFRMAALDRPDSPLTRATFLAERHLCARPWDSAALTQSLIDAWWTWRPDLIVPTDEWSLMTLRDLGVALPPGLPSVLERSLGAQDFQHLTARKEQALEAARRTGMTVPATRSAADRAGAQVIAAEFGFPVMLKDDQGTAGMQVRFCRSPADLAQAWDDLEGDAADERSLLVQAFIPGRVVCVNLVAWQGRLLDAFAYVPLECSRPYGPATVIQPLGCDPRDTPAPALLERASRIAAAWGLNGFVGLDFMETPEGGLVFLECNRRPTASTHLGRRLGHDLPAALFSAMTGVAPRPSAPAPGAARAIALFPHEWLRDPASPWLAEAVPDIPWEDPVLVQALAEEVRLDRASLGRDDRKDGPNP